MNRPDWVPDTVFYQIFPDRFRNGRPDLNPSDVAPWGSPPDREHFQGGDLAGITEGLEYLESLGVTGLYLNPIFAAETNHRYDTRDYYTVDPRLGDLGELRELVDEAHSRKIRVILDGVFNHCGDRHPAFLDWQVTRDQGEHAWWFFGYDTTQPDGTPDYQTCGGAAYLPKLNTEHPAVRDHLIGCATYWIEEVGVDGWRLDVPWKVEGGFWDEFTKAIQAVAPDSYIVGEIWRDASPFLHQFHGCTNYQQRAAILDYCIHDAFDGEDFMIEIADLLDTHDEAAPWMLNLVGSHDTPRLRTVATDEVDRVLLALTTMFSLPGAPLIYYGDEIGLEGGPDPDCRRAMPWVKSRWNHSILDRVKSLVRIRAEHPALRRGSLRRLTERNGLVAFLRFHEQDRVVTVLNPRGAQRELLLPVTDGVWRDALSGSLYHVSEHGLLVSDVPATSSMILVEESPRQ